MGAPTFTAMVVRDELPAPHFCVATPRRARRGRGAGCGRGLASQPRRPAFTAQPTRAVAATAPRRPLTRRELRTAMYYTTDSAKLDDTDPPPPPPVLQARRTSSSEGLTFVKVTPVTEPSPSSPAPDIARLLSSEHQRRRASNAESSRNSSASPARAPSGGLRKLKKMATSPSCSWADPRRRRCAATPRNAAEAQDAPADARRRRGDPRLVVATGVGPRRPRRRRRR